MVLGGALLAAAWALAPRPPKPEARSVAAMLGEAVHGAVDEADFVWGPSRGWLLDLTAGREVVFLYRATPEAPREPCRASVSVTPDGRPLSVRATKPLARTREGDERDIVLAHGRVAFTTWFADRPQSVVVEELAGDGRVMRIALPPEARSVDVELGSSDVLVVSRELDWSSVVSFADGQSTAGKLAHVVEGSAAVPNGELPPARLNIKSVDSSLVLPIEGFSPELSLGEGRPPAVSSRKVGSATVFVVDGRQFDFALQLGADSPPTETGYLPRLTRARANVAFALAIPKGREQGRAGAFDKDGFSGPMRTDVATLVPEGASSFSMIPWKGGAWERRDHETAIQWPSATDAPGAHALCVMPGGHLAFATSDTADGVEEALPAPCVSLVTDRGPLHWAAPADGLLPESERDSSLILGARRAFTPSIAPPKGGGWGPARVQPTPAFLPAVFEARTEVLGAEVSVLYVERGRVKWTMVAGEKERPHREGRELDRALSASDAAQARLAISLAYAKRKGPRGLRIRGNTGLGFSGSAGVLGIENGALRLFPGPPPGLDALSDASELPLVAAERALRPEARELGPRQKRADLCVLPSGVVLLAESQFDSHEANATVLLGLGCSEVVALDRGTEQPSETVWGSAAGGPFVSTQLVALDVPLDGAVHAHE